jgi:hypothetical protein
MRQRTIAGKKNFEACPSSGAEQYAVPEPIPTLTANGGNIMVRKFRR